MLFRGSETLTNTDVGNDDCDTLHSMQQVIHTQYMMTDMLQAYRLQDDKHDTQYLEVSIDISCDCWR